MGLNDISIKRSENGVNGGTPHVVKKAAGGGGEVHLTSADVIHLEHEYGAHK